MTENLTDTNFNEIVNLIQSAKQKAYAQVNNTLIELYWDVGQYLCLKTTKENWGKSVVSDLATYITQKDPTIKGFTSRGLWRMKHIMEM